MSKYDNVTDEMLDKMLSELNSEKNIQIKDDSRPPVINAYRLEKERLRREKRRLVTMASIAAVISAFLLAIFVWIIIEIYSVQIHEFIEKLQGTDLYLNIEKIVIQYGTEIKLILASMLLLFVMSAVFSAVLLVKNKDKLLHSN